MHLFLKLLINAAAVGITAALLPGVSIENYWVAILVALVIALINLLVKPLVFVLTLPITLLTLGLFYIVINALMIELADWFVPGFAVQGFWWALLFSIILSFVNSALHSFFRNNTTHSS
jgi:putative membrane protein